MHYKNNCKISKNRYSIILLYYIIRIILCKIINAIFRHIYYSRISPLRFGRFMARSYKSTQCRTKYNYNLKKPKCRNNTTIVYIQFKSNITILPPMDMMGIAGYNNIINLLTYELAVDGFKTTWGRTFLN